MDINNWMLFLWALSFADSLFALASEEDPEDVEDKEGILEDESYDDFKIPQNSPNQPYPPLYPYVNNNLHHEDREYGRACTDKMERTLENIRRRHIAKEKMLHLNGYALHQQMRTAPVDMYVTDMRVRMPHSKSWVRVEECRFNPINQSLETRLLFNDLTISGKVNLYDDILTSREPDSLKPDDKCNMILRLRKAGIGFRTEPIKRERGQLNVKTDSHFLEPGFISVYAYGCEPGLKRSRRERDPLNPLDRDFRAEEEEDEMSREMEDIFLKGIRSLLTSYMQKELQPAIKETLMRNMGYTVSYG